MTKQESYEAWQLTDPIERTAYSGYMAGWDAAYENIRQTIGRLVDEMPKMIEGE